MNIIVVDDEEIILAGETAMIRQCAPGAQVHGFSSPTKALAYLRDNPADVAFLDLEMPELHGLELARQMKAIAPRLNIIFATAYPDYSESAMHLRASGYLLKPIRIEQIREELENLRYPVSARNSGLFVRAFGNFEVFYNGSPVMFRYSKTKELLAYLIDRRGALVSRDELITVLWGGETERANYYKQVQKDLNDVLEQLGKKDVLVKQRGALGILTDKINCDYYEWLKGEPRGLNAFMGEYMRQYDWGEATLVNITNWGGRD